MPRLAAFRPGHLAVVVELGVLPYYQVLFGATTWDRTPCFALQVMYPPSPLALMRPDGVPFPLTEFARVTLLRLPVHFSTEAGEVDKIAKAGNDSATIDEALSRVPEAFNLFKNNPRVKADEVERVGKDAAELVKVGWDLRMWLLGSAEPPQRKQWDVLGATLVATP